MNRSKSGFTIVELLIVIVVIAILAAISLIGYNGITAQAKSAEILSRVDAYTKALRLYQAENNSFPTVIQSETGMANTACLGSTSDYPSDANFGAGQCYKQNPMTVVTPSSTLNGQLKNFISTLPKGSTPAVISTDNNTYLRGLLYTSFGSSSAILQYFQAGENQKCGRGGASSGLAQFPGVTLCTVTL